MPYPASLDAPDTSMQGTSLFTGDDHALQHRTVGSAIVNIETTLGTNAGTSVIKNFNAGDFAARINSGGILQQSLAGTINNSVIGTPSITGGTVNTAQITNGTLGTMTVDASKNTITNLGTGAFSTGQFMRMGSQTQNYFMQFGTVSLAAGGASPNNNIFVSFPTAFPGSCIAAWVGGGGAGSIGGQIVTKGVPYVDGITAGSIEVGIHTGDNTNLSAGTYYLCWSAIGY